MKTLVAKSVFAAALIATPLISTAGSLESGLFPAPVHLVGFSVSLTGYSNDLSLLASPRNQANPANSVSLAFVARISTAAGETRRVSVIKRADASSFRFDARLPDSPVGLRAPQAGTLYFSPNNTWNFRKQD